MPKYRLSGRQMAWLVAVFIFAPAIINLPQILARVAMMDAWITQLLPLVYAFAVGYVYYLMAKVFPGKTFFEINFLLAGKLGGGIINIVFLIHIWFILAKNTTLLVSFIKTNLLLRTPYEMILFLLILVLVYYGRTSLEVITRVNDIFFAFLAFIVLSLPFLLSNDLSVAQMQPTLVQPAADLGIANMLSAAWYGDIIVFAAFLPVIANPKLLYSSVRHGISIAALLITWILITGVIVLGPSITAREVYPTYSMIQQIHITDFLDRMEIFIFSVYFPSFIVSIAICFYAILIGLGSFDRANRHQIYSKTAGLFILITLVFAFEGTPEVAVFSNYAYPAFVFAFQPAGLLIILLLLAVRIRRDRKSGQSGQARANPGRAQNASGSTKRSVRKWQAFTYVLIVIGIASIAVGLWVAKDNQFIGRTCIVVYALALLLLVLSTNREMKSFNE